MNNQSPSRDEDVVFALVSKPKYIQCVQKKRLPQTLEFDSVFFGRIISINLRNIILSLSIN